MELEGQELEELIEKDDPSEPGAGAGNNLEARTDGSPAPADALKQPQASSFVMARTEQMDSEDVDLLHSTPAPISSPGAMVTGPGLGAERTDQISIETLDPDLDSSIDLDMSAGDTASLRKDQLAQPPPVPAQAAGRATSRNEAINEMLGAQLGSYRLLTLLGEGGMGQVFMAEHVKLERKVALKLLRPEYVVRRDAVRRFFQEAKAVNKIGHENIVDITDLVELKSGHTFIIMELLEGEDLSDIQKSMDRPMPLHRAMQIAVQVCDALEAAHRTGVVHRDLKPDNIFIVNSGTKRDFVKLLDFGVAKLLGDNEEIDGFKTAVGSVIGTPAYMSPEQASGIPVDHRSDIYSLGAIMYELFTTHPVFRAKSFGEFVVKHMNDDPIPPRDLANAPKLPAALEQVILRCLEKDPARRYQSVVDLRDDLARATATVETVIKASPLAPVAPKKNRKWLLVLPLGAAVAILAVVAFWLASGLSIDDVRSDISDPKAAPAPVTPQPQPKASTSPLAASQGEDPPVQALVKLRTQPEGAVVFRLDKPNKPLGKTPLDLYLSEVGQDLEFKFKLPGHVSATESVSIADNTIVSVALERLPQPHTPRETVSPKPRPRTTPLPEPGPVSKPLKTITPPKEPRKPPKTQPPKPPKTSAPKLSPKAKKPRKPPKTGPAKPSPKAKKPRKPPKTGPAKINPNEQVDPFAD